MRRLLCLLVCCLATQSHAQASAGRCQTLSRELVAAHAKDNLILFMVLDENLLHTYAKSWLDAVRAVGIDYFIVGAMDVQTSLALPKIMPEGQCFNAPVAPTPTSGGYKWGSAHFLKTTWKKVAVAQQLYNMGFHVLFSDADVSWLRDPLPYFQQHYSHDRAPHALFATDSLDTHSQPGDEGLEKGTSPFFNINTGVYMIKQHVGGNKFFDVWLSFNRPGVGHDQDGLNDVVRGRARASNPALNMPAWSAGDRVVFAAQHNTTGVSYLPTHIVANSYTYLVGRVHMLYKSKILAVHWVWFGPTPESKVANIRDAMQYSDPPEYYNAPNLTLLTMDLDRPVAPPDFNQRNIDQTESMVQFHLFAARYQLQQAYYGIMAAAALQRTFVLPGYHCFCAKNWYMTQGCRVNGERHTRFPYMCRLSDIMRARKVSQGIEIQPSEYIKRVVHVREWPFLHNPKVPTEIRRSRVVLFPIPDGPARSASDPPDRTDLPVTMRSVADGMEAFVPWPLNTRELDQLVATHFSSYRIIHLANATKLLDRGWATAEWQRAFDASMEKYSAQWCCRGPKTMEEMGLPRKEVLSLVPPKLQAKPAA